MTPQGTAEQGVGTSATDPCSPFTPDGHCRSCDGFAEHFRWCAHAAWERRELG